MLFAISVASAMDAVFAQTDFKASYGVINTLNKSISVEEFSLYSGYMAEALRDFLHTVQE